MQFIMLCISLQKINIVLIAVNYMAGSLQQHSIIFIYKGLLQQLPHFIASLLTFKTPAQQS